MSRVPTASGTRLKTGQKPPGTSGAGLQPGTATRLATAMNPGQLDLVLEEDRWLEAVH